MTSKKIHIIGAPGSGKSYLGKKLARHLSAPIQDLDDIFWDNNATHYGIKASDQDRDAKLQAFISQPAWVSEGVYYKWVGPCFDATDAIIILQPASCVRNYRIILRSIARALGIDKAGKKQTFKGMMELITWGNEYEREKIPTIIAMLEPYTYKTHFFKGADQAFAFILTLQKE